MRAIAVFPDTREVKMIEHEEPRITRPTEVKLRIREVGVKRREVKWKNEKKSLK